MWFKAVQRRTRHNSIDAIDSPAVVWVPQKGTQPHLSLWRKNEDVHLHVKYVLHHTRDTSTHFPRQPKNQNAAIVHFPTKVLPCPVCCPIYYERATFKQKQKHASPGAEAHSLLRIQISFSSLEMTRFSL